MSSVFPSLVTSGAPGVLEGKGTGTNTCDHCRPRGRHSEHRPHCQMPPGSPPPSVPPAGPSFKRHQEHLHAPNLLVPVGLTGPRSRARRWAQSAAAWPLVQSLHFFSNSVSLQQFRVPLDSATGAGLRDSGGLRGAVHTGGLSLHLCPGSCARKAESPATNMRGRVHVHTLTTRSARRAPPSVSLSPTLTGLDLGSNRCLHVAGQEAAPPATQVLPWQAGPAPGTAV